MPELRIHSFVARNRIKEYLRESMYDEQASTVTIEIVRRLIAAMPAPNDPPLSRENSDWQVPSLPELELRIDSTVAQRRIAECLRETRTPAQANTLASEIVGRLIP